MSNYCDVHGLEYIEECYKCLEWNRMFTNREKRIEPYVLQK